MIRTLRIYDPILQKVRIGNNWDGGYVVALQSLGRSAALFSYGVGTDISFEKAYVDATNRTAYCYDHTISDIGIEDKYKYKLFYHKEGISGIPTENCDNFINHYKKMGLTDRVLFKADTEGAEYEFILNTDISELAKITTGLVFEFHYLQDPNRQKQFFECMHKLNEHFYLCHVHGNNYSQNFAYDEPIPNSEYVRQYLLPEVIELTFVNKDLVREPIIDKRVYPNEYLDRKNDLGRLELDLSFLNLINQ